MNYRKQLLITTAALALAPFAAQAAATSWTGTTSNAWNTKGNWSANAVPGATSGVTIGVTKNNPVHLNVNSSLTGSGGSLTLGAAESLILDSGFTLTMGANTATLNGSLTGPGTFSSTGAVNLSGATLSGLTLAGSGGQENVLGDTTLTGTINYATGSSQTFNIGGANGAHTLNLDTATLSVTGTGQGAFTIGTGGVLNNKNKASSITTVGTIGMSGGSITNTSGTGGTTAGLFTIANPVSGYGSISGNVALNGTGLTASGGVVGTPQTLTVDGGAGAGIALGTGAVTTAGANNTLDLKGNIGVTSSLTMNPTLNGLIDFDGVNFSKTGGSPGIINPTSPSLTTTAGTFDVVGTGATFSNVAFSAGTAAAFKIDAPLSIDATSSVSAKNVTLNGQTVTGPGSLNATSTITSTGASTLAAPFTGGLNVSTGTLDVKSAGTSGSSTVTTTLNIDSGGSWTTTSGVTNNGLINLNTGGKWTLPNALTALTNNGTVALNGGTLQGPTGFFNTAGMFGAGKFNVTADSTLAGNFSWNSLGNTFNIGGALGAHTLNLDTATLSTVSSSVPPFLISTGGTLNNAKGASTLSGGGTTVLQGGSLTNTGGGLFTFNNLISGFGNITGPMNIVGGVTATGGTMVVDGTSAPITVTSAGWGTGGSAGDVLDLKGTFNFTNSTGFLQPTGATVQLDGATLNTPGNSGSIWAGNNLNSKVGLVNVASGVNTLNGNVVPNGSNSSTSNFNVKNGATFSLQNASPTVTAAVAATNFNMENGSKLVVGSGHNAISLTGNFSFQQTDTINGWTNGSVTGLGPDLAMKGGTSVSPLTLEAGGLNKGSANPNAWVNNFALDSLTLGTSSYVGLVDQFQNATLSGWTSGSEVLYLDGLFGLIGGGPTNPNTPILNLDGIEAFLLGHGFLYDGYYTNPVDGSEVLIVGASSAPEPAAMLLFGTGLAGLFLVRRRRS